MNNGVMRFPTALNPRLLRGIFCAALALAALGGARAADTSQPVVGPGATKEEAIDAYGWPTGQSQLGTKEILNYPQGSITLENGRVERVDFSTKIPWPAPRPRPGTPAEAAAKRAEARSFDPWTTSFPDAVAQARKQHAHILAAFVGSDWSPPSQRFLAEVATHPDFVNGLMGDFVFLKLDFPTRVALPAALKQQNDDLRARCSVTTYPALVVLSTRGDPVAVVNLTRESAGESYRAHLIAAVSEVRDMLKQRPVIEEPAPAPAAPPPAPPATPPINLNGGKDGLVHRLMASAGSALALGLGGGLALALLLVWLVWRSRPLVNTTSAARPTRPQPGVRLRDLPSLAELQALPAEPLRQLVAALFEATGYTATIRPRDAEIDVELRLRGHAKASVLVCCRPAGAGPIGAKAVREFFGSLVASSVDAGWMVATGGFAEEAHPAAAERGIELIDGEGLIERLRQLPAAELGAVLSKAGA
jgi:hypothetical protein